MCVRVCAYKANVIHLDGPNELCVTWLLHVCVCPVNELSAWFVSVSEKLAKLALEPSVLLYTRCTCLIPHPIRHNRHQSSSVVNSITRNRLLLHLMYRLIEWIRVLALTPTELNNNSEMSSDNEAIVHRKRHAKYFQRCLDVLPPRLASHDSTRLVFFIGWPSFLHSSSHFCHID